MEKVDPALRQKINYAEKENPSEQIEFLGRCTNNIDDKIKKNIEGKGINIQTVAGDIFTASGTAAQIKSLAGMDIIKNLELSVTRKFN